MDGRHRQPAAAQQHNSAAGVRGVPFQVAEPGSMVERAANHAVATDAGGIPDDLQGGRRGDRVRPTWTVRAGGRLGAGGGGGRPGPRRTKVTRRLLGQDPTGWAFILPATVLVLGL